MAGIIQVGQQYKNQAKQGLQQVAGMEEAREMAGDNMEQAAKAMTMNAVGTGAGIGMMAGMQAGAIGGPAGAALGAGIGLIASQLF